MQIRRSTGLGRLVQQVLGPAAMSVRLVSLVLLSIVAWSVAGEGVARAQETRAAPDGAAADAHARRSACTSSAQRGLELLIAEANVRSAEGAREDRRRGAQPRRQRERRQRHHVHQHELQQQNCLANGAACTPWIYSIGVTDSAALEDTLSGKRDLRSKVARNALAAAKMSRVDAERTLTFQVESAYLQVAQAVLGLKFAKDVADSNVTLLEKVRDLAGGGEERNHRRGRRSHGDAEERVGPGARHRAADAAAGTRRAGVPAGRPRRSPRFRRGHARSRLPRAGRARQR